MTKYQAQKFNIYTNHFYGVCVLKTKREAFDWLQGEFSEFVEAGYKIVDTKDKYSVVGFDVFGGKHISKVVEM